MINFSPVTSTDLEQLQEWIQHDPYHYHQGQPDWWVGADAVLAFCLMDERGPLCYVRLDAEGEYIRIHTQFAPRTIVSRRRLISGMLRAIECLMEMYKSTKGLVFNSVNPTLVGFMRRIGFQAIGDNDYRLSFGE